MHSKNSPMLVTAIACCFHNFILSRASLNALPATNKKGDNNVGTCVSTEWYFVANNAVKKSPAPASTSVSYTWFA